MNPYAQSVVWLVGFGGLGYVLMEMTKPDEKKLEAIRNTSQPQVLRERDQKRELFMQKLAAAGSAGEKPVYLKTPAELVRENRGESSK